ncbi:MAG: hypothetical protein D6746_08500 [Bacteroidetes bacterium]|nr:MAG: hypothetical protein D6746_08500 [Bacteroidota bacterium]
MDLVNDAIRRNQLMPRFLRGKGKEEVLRTGPKIKDRMLLEYTSNFRAYGPHDVHNYSNPQTGDEWQNGWSYYTEEMVWTEQELLHNFVPGLTKSAQKTVLKDVKNQKEQRVITSIVEGLDDLLWAQPNYATMENPAEGQTATCMSIPALINEQPNGLYTLASVTGTWVNKQNVSPASKSAWVPQQISYASDSAGLVDEFTGLFNAFRRMRRRLRFRPPSIGQEHFEGDNYTRMFIACSEEGIVQYENMLQQAGDKLRGNVMNPRDSSYGEVTFHGHVLEEVEALRDANLYLNSGGTDLVSETDANVAASGPRYYWINTNYMHIMLHKNKWLEKRKPKEPDRQIEVWVQPVVMWLQLVATSLRRHGIVYPST